MLFHDDIFDVSLNARHRLADIGEMHACEAFTKRLYIVVVNAEFNARGCQPVKHSLRVKLKWSNSDIKRLRFNDAQLKRRVLIAYV